MPVHNAGLRRTAKAKQRRRSRTKSYREKVGERRSRTPSYREKVGGRRSRTKSYREKVGEQKVDVPEENATESTGIVHSKEQAVEQPQEKDVPAQKNDKGQSESVHSRVLSFSFN